MYDGKIILHLKSKGGSYIAYKYYKEEISPLGLEKIPEARFFQKTSH